MKAPHVCTPLSCLNFSFGGPGQIGRDILGFGSGSGLGGYVMNRNRGGWVWDEPQAPETESRRTSLAEGMIRKARQLLRASDRSEKNEKEKPRKGHATLICLAPLHLS